MRPRRRPIQLKLLSAMLELSLPDEVEGVFDQVGLDLKVQRGSKSE